MRGEEEYSSKEGNSGGEEDKKASSRSNEMIIYLNFKYERGGEREGRERWTYKIDYVQSIESVLGIIFYLICSELGARREGCSRALYNHHISKLQIIVS